MRGRALVTGAAGFVGCHVARALAADGWQVVGVARPGGSDWRLSALPPELDLAAIDLGADPAGVARLAEAFAPALVVHAAARGAYAGRDLAAGVRDDLLGFTHLLAALPDGCRVVALGSSLEVAAGAEKIRESAPFAPRGPRGTLRAAATLLALDEARAGRLEIGVLRLFTIYGPWEADHRLVPKAIVAAYSGEPLPLTAPPHPTHDYVFVEDAAAACLAAAAAADFPGRVWNVCSGIATGDGELVAAVEQATGRPIHRRVGEWQSRHPERPYWCGDPAATAAGLGWRAATALERGLALTAAWHRERSGRQEPWRSPS